MAVETGVKMPTIRPLEPLVVNQIAAGEVVERPASVVRELLDNAIDAKPTRISIELERGGIELVRITDDGMGIPREQLHLALAPHATSKLSSAEDLTRIATLGFRGEALASIASVSRLTIRSRPGDSGEACELAADAGAHSEPRPASGPVGTCVAVRNLFFNTPARRRFLRTPQTEQQHCVTAARRAAIAHPSIGFTLTIDGRVSFDLPPGQSPRERVLAVLGKEFEEAYLEAHADEFDDARGLALWGLIGLPVLAKAHTNHQYVFLNGRFLRDRTIQHAFREAYRGLIEPGKHPAGVLMLEMDPAAVDVNVHPAKLEVRFRDSSLVHRVVQLAARRVLSGADLTPTDEGAHERRVRFEAADASGLDRALADHIRSVSPLPSVQTDASVMDRPLATDEADGDERAMGERTRTEVPSPAASSEIEIRAPRPLPRLMQVHNSFVVTQDERGLVIIDQHALHERVMFQRLLERVSAGPLDSQSLLMPLPIDATEDQIESLTGIAAVLERAGIVIEQAGHRSLVLRGFTSLLLERGVEPEEFIAELLDAAGDLPGSHEALLHEVLDMMACKAAVKAGDRMSDAELAELVSQREEVERAASCPHGRPTAIRLSIAELERQFGRT